MAELTVPDKRSVPWWPLIILGGVVLAVAGWMLMGTREEPRRMAVPAPKAEAPTEGAYAGTITELAPLIAPGDRAGLADREVALEGVQVQQVLADRAFLVGPGGAQRALVVVDSADGKIGTGDTVAIHGKVRPLPVDQDTRARLGLDALRPAELAGLQVMVEADRVVETFDRSGAR